MFLEAFSGFRVAGTLVEPLRAQMGTILGHCRLRLAWSVGPGRHDSCKKAWPELGEECYVL